MHAVERCVSLQKLPHGVMLRGTVVESDDFFNQRLPPVGSVVNPLGQRGSRGVVCGVLGGVYELFGFDTAAGANHGVVFRNYVEGWTARARHNTLLFGLEKANNF